MTFAACGSCGSQSVQLGFEVARRDFQQGSVHQLFLEAVNVQARRGALLQLKERERGILCSNLGQFLLALDGAVPTRGDDHCGKKAWSGTRLQFSAWGSWREKQGNASVRGRRAMDLRIPATVSGGNPMRQQARQVDASTDLSQSLHTRNSPAGLTFLPYFSSVLQMNAGGILDHDFERRCSKD